MNRFYFTAFSVFFLAFVSAQEVFLVRDIDTTSNSRGPNGSFPKELRAYGDQLLFTADDQRFGNELFITDGTEEGTRRLTNINTTTIFAQNDSDPDLLAIIDDEVYYSAREESRGFELYVTDLVTEETRRLTDLNPGEGDAEPRGGTVLNGELLFHANAPGNLRGWYKYVPAQDTVIFLADADPNKGAGASFFGGATVFNGRAYYPSQGVETGIELFFTDGTPAGTGLFRDPRPGSQSSRQRYLFAEYQGNLYFQGDNRRFGAELHRTTDGTPATIQMMGDVNRGAGGSDPQDLALVNDRLFFTANSQNDGRELYYTQGDSADFRKFGNFANSSADEVTYDWHGLLDYGSFGLRRLLTIDQGSGGSLFALSSTPNSTTIVSVPGTFGRNPESVVTVGSTAYFTLETDNGRQLFRFRTADSAPEQLTFFDPVRFSNEVKNVRRAGNFIYFTANDLEVGTELYAVGIDNPARGVFASRLDGDTLTVDQTVAFDEVPSRTDSTRTVWISNEGDAPLLYLARLGEATAFSLAGDTLSGTLAPGDSLALSLTFSPLTEGPFTDTLLVDYVLRGFAPDTVRLGYGLAGNAIVNGIVNRGLLATRAFPNPTQGEVFVELARVPTATHFMIFDGLGRQLQQGDWPRGARRYTFDLREFPAGTYYLHLWEKAGRSVIRLIKR